MPALLASASLMACTTVAAVSPVPNDIASSLKLAPGFSISTFAKLNPGKGEAFREPRFMAFGPDGNLYVASSSDDKIYMLPDSNHDGVADEIVTAVTGLNAPNSLIFADGKMLVSNQDGVVRVVQESGKWPAKKLEPIIKGLPTGGHTLKTVRLGPDKHLYLNVGSSCNVCVEKDPLRATILRYTLDGEPAGSPDGSVSGSKSAVWASGLRNSQGMAWQPGSMIFMPPTMVLTCALAPKMALPMMNCRPSTSTILSRTSTMAGHIAGANSSLTPISLASQGSVPLPSRPRLPYARILRP